MPNLIDIVEVAESLEEKNVLTAADRCVSVRNRNAKCRKCQEVCPASAFKIECNKLELDSSLCLACGTCTVVCPTEALIPLRPLDETLVESIAVACEKTERIIVFACARIAAKQLADPEKFVEVPCLARLEESLLLELAAREVASISLVDGNCSTCKYRACNKSIDATVSSANTLLAATKSSMRVHRSSDLPEELTVEDASELYGTARRNFFSQTRGRAKDAAEKTVTSVLSRKKDQKTLSIQERLGISEAGTLPQFEPTRRMRILDALDRMGVDLGIAIETRLWGNVVIDLERCNACGMCSVFCPTGALKKVELVSGEGKKQEKQLSLEFSMADCVQCNTCSDICLKHCLEVEILISLEELFDFEPRVILLSAPSAKAKVG